VRACSAGGRRHVGALTAKGDRHFATAVDLQIERARSAASSSR
jgi:hypothetical protein